MSCWFSEQSRQRVSPWGYTLCKQTTDKAAPPGATGDSPPSYNSRNPRSVALTCDFKNTFRQIRLSLPLTKWLPYRPVTVGYNMVEKQRIVEGNRTLRDIWFVCFAPTFKNWRERERRDNSKWCVLPPDAACASLSVIDKVWTWDIQNVTHACWLLSGITVWSGFAGWSHMKTNRIALGKCKMVRSLWHLLLSTLDSEDVLIRLWEMVSTPACWIYIFTKYDNAMLDETFTMTACERR